MPIKKKQVITDYLLCNLSLVPIYHKANDASAMISQMLFGETCKIILKKDKRWSKIITSYDSIEGFVLTSQFEYLSEQDFNKINVDFSVALDLCQVLKNEAYTSNILIGSSLPQFDGMTTNFNGKKYLYNGNSVPFSKHDFTPEMFEKIAMKFVNAPYMRGGRSLFGLDHYTFVQLVYKCAGIKLPSHLSALINKSATVIDFVELARSGDIAFFNDKNGDLVHVGILLDNDAVIHCLEKVRVDTIDHEGLYDKASKKYLFKLKHISRLV